MTTLSEWFRDIITWGLGILSGLMAVVMAMFVYIFQGVLKSIDERFAQRLKIEEELKGCIKDLKEENRELFERMADHVTLIDRSLHRLHGRFDSDSDKKEQGRHTARQGQEPRLREDKSACDRPSDEDKGD